MRSQRLNAAPGFYRLVLGLFAAILLGSVPAWANLSDYQFSTSSTTYSSISSNGTQIMSPTQDDAATSAINIGFTFVFDGTSYTQFSASSNGLLGLGSSSVTTAYSNSIPSYYPIIAAYWDDMYLSNSTNGIWYYMSGSSPNRVLTVQWNIHHISSSASEYNSQVKLYEGSNKIELIYGSTSTYASQSGSIGAVVSSSNFASITPGSPATISYSSANNNIGSSSHPSNGTVYTLAPCQANIKIAGNTAQGGTTAMANNDSLLMGITVNRGNTQTFQPYTISMGAQPCSPSTAYYYTITGPNAADYSISPASGNLSASGSNTPTLSFTPSGLGKRAATLIVNDGAGLSLSYPLAGVGTTRINWIGNVSQGGTSPLLSGDTLMRDIIVVRRGTGNFTPITIENFSKSSSLAPITYSINDPTGQYSVAPASAQIGGGQTSSPVITFNPTGVGPQPATLTVNADGEIRTFVLYAFSAAPGGTFVIGGRLVTPQTDVFTNISACVGDASNSQAVTITNVGVSDFLITAVNFYRTDTMYQQGTPAYPLLRDQNNNPIPSTDYYFSNQPGGAPISLPIAVPEKQSRTIYLNFMGAYPGKRFARAYIQTNGQNFLGTNLAGTDVEGLLKFDLFARSTGAALSDNPNGGLPKAVVFQETAVGDSVDATVSIFNTGICDLRISKTYLKIFSGDVNEFKIVSAFPGTPTNGNDFLLGPGMSGTITVRFLPARSGTRRATVWMRTNDSTIYIPGVTNRGDYFLDLFGPGKAGLDVPDVTFQPAIIDGENSIAEAMVVNSSTELLGIAQIRIIGPDAAEFAENPAKKWPTPLPKAVQPGEELKLSVVHTATSGSAPGPRQAKLEITLTNGQIIIVELSGAAWTRTASASLSKPFTQTTIGTLQRRVIRIENTGWAPLVLQMPTLTGLDASEFALGNLSRMVLDSGQVEFLEVTYAPTRAGTATATVNILSNATNGAQTVTLNGSAKTARDDEGVDDGAITIGRENGDGDVAQTGTSGVNSGVIAGVMELRQSVPNPASGSVQISYVLAQRGQVSLALYDERGAAIQNLVIGAQESGEHAVTMDVSGLPSGVYHYRLEVNGRMVSRTMRVVH